MNICGTNATFALFARPLHCGAAQWLSIRPEVSKNIVPVELPNGSTYHATREEAHQLVRTGTASWKDEKHRGIRIAPELVARGLSCKVGAYLATLIARRVLWAQVMHRQIKMQTEPTT
jgi:hypothetical protein